MIKVGLVYRDVLGSGGYPRDVRWLASALTSCGVAVTLFGRAGTVTEGLTDSVRVEPLERLTRSDVDLYHFFGIFIPEQVWALQKVLHKRVVVSPMGHLMPYHLRRKALKKKVYLRVAKVLLRRVKWFHAFGSPEVSSIRRYLSDNVLTFEASLGVFPVPVAIAEAEWRKMERTDGADLLFFGRNDVYQKGIDILLEGFARAVRRGKCQTGDSGPALDGQRALHQIVH
jgi:glycosyltransferase involved in cell wall biosynthesis